jgi:Bacterial membrane protein YfhO
MKFIAPFVFILIISFIFFYKVISNGYVPLPADALVGAHVPWTEMKWEEYPTGIPIKNLEITDAFSQFYPWRQLVGDHWRNAKIPLWNHYMFSGAPFLASLHSSSLYPLNILYVLFDDITSWTLLVYLQILLSGIFMFLFLREFALKIAPALFGAIVFSYSGYMISWLEFATGGHAGLWLPFLLWCSLKYTKHRSPLALILIPLAFFCVYTAGDFQVPMYVTITYITFCVYISYKNLRTMVHLLVAFVLGVLLSLPQLLPTLELYLRSVRMGDPYIKEYFFGLMHWGKFTNFIWPDFYGNVVTGNYWGQYGFHEYMGFVGVTTLVILIVQLFIPNKSSYERYFWSVLFVSLLFLFPTPIAFIPYTFHVPGFGTSSASRILFLLGFCSAVIAAFGVQDFHQKIKKAYVSLGILTVISLFVAFVLSYAKFLSIYKISVFTVDETKIQIALKNMIPATIIILTLGLAFLLTTKLKKRQVLPYVLLFFVTVEMLWFSLKNTPFSPREFVFPDTKVTTFLSEASMETPGRVSGGIPLNLFMPYRVASVEGYDSLYPTTNSEWFSLVNSKSLDALSGRYGQVHDYSSNLLPYANVRYIVDYKKNQYGGISEDGNLYPGNTDDTYVSVFADNRISVYENIKSYPRVWVSRNIIKAHTKEDYIDVLVDKSTDPKIILDTELPHLEDIPISYRLSDYTLGYNEITFTLWSSEDGYAFHSNSYDPGWKLFIDNTEKKLYQANYIFQSFPVTSGVHEIKMIYEPDSFKVGINISALSAVFLIGWYSVLKAKSRYKLQNK